MKRKFWKSAGFLLAGVLLAGCGAVIEQNMEVESGTSSEVPANMETEATGATEENEPSSQNEPQENDWEVDLQKDVDYSDVMESFTERLLAETGATREELLFADVDIYYDYRGTEDVYGFFFLGSKIEDEYSVLYEGCPYFVDEDRVVRLMDKYTFWDVNRTIACEAVGKKFYCVDEYYATAAVTRVFTVENGQPVEADISGLGSLDCPKLVKPGESFTILLSAYDGCLDKNGEYYIGHTWKPYYFYFDVTKRGFKEFKGELITREKLEELCGFDMAAETEEKCGTVTEIFYRKNGIISINYNVEDDSMIEYGNVNYDLNKGRYLDAWGAEVYALEGSDFGGSYVEGILCE